MAEGVDLASVLVPGEQVLWQARPTSNRFEIIATVIVCALVPLGMVYAWQSGDYFLLLAGWLPVYAIANLPGEQRGRAATTFAITTRRALHVDARTGIVAEAELGPESAARRVGWPKTHLLHIRPKAVPAKRFGRHELHYFFKRPDKALGRHGGVIIRGVKDLSEAARIAEAQTG